MMEGVDDTEKLPLKIVETRLIEDMTEIEIREIGADQHQGVMMMQTLSDFVPVRTLAQGYTTSTPP